jgi:hypothetical protein
MSHPPAGASTIKRGTEMFRHKGGNVGGFPTERLAISRDASDLNPFRCGLRFVFLPSFIFNNMARFVLGSFPVRFFHRNVFSTTSPLRFPVRPRFAFG